MSSDAMIFDSISFISEYLFVNKPCLFLVKDETIKYKFNEYGSKAFSLMYQAKESEDIIYFINNVLLGANDLLSKERESFVNSVLLPPNGMTASQNIYNDLIKELTA